VARFKCIKEISDSKKIKEVKKRRDSASTDHRMWQSRIRLVFESKYLAHG
jgi:hypothetical protein